MALALDTVMLSVANKPIMLTVSVLSVIMLNANMPSLFMRSVIMLSVIMPSVFMRSVIMLSVVLPSVAAP
jgi:hypothetical protein